MFGVTVGRRAKWRSFHVLVLALLLFVHRNVFGCSFLNPVAAHLDYFVLTVFVADPDPSFVVQEVGTEHWEGPTRGAINYKSSVQIELFEDDTPSFHDQRGTGTDANLIGLWDFITVLGGTARKRGMEYDGGTRYHRNAQVRFGRSIVDVTSNRSQDTTDRPKLIGFATGSSPRLRPMCLQHCTFGCGILDRGKAQFGRHTCKAHTRGVVSNQNGREVLHHAFQSGGFLEGGLGGVLVFRIDEFWHESLRALQHSDILLKIEQQLIDVARKRRTTRLWVVHVTIFVPGRRAQQRVQLIVLHVDGSARDWHENE